MPEQYFVTIKAFGHIKSTYVDADSRREAEEKALLAVGFSVESKAAFKSVGGRP